MKLLLVVVRIDKKGQVEIFLPCINKACFIETGHISLQYFFFLSHPKHNMAEVETRQMEYGTHFIWKLSFSAKLKYYTHSIIKLAFPDYQSSLSSNLLIYFSSKLPDFWPNVFTLQALCCKTSFSSFELFIKTLKNDFYTMYKRWKIFCI